jgi:SAM-dependent methyltransferase
VIERDLPPELAAALAEPGPDDAPYPRLLEHLSIYLDAHWGDRAAPPPDGPGAGFGAGALIERIAARAAAPVELAVELGCSVGRGVAALAAGAAHVVGIEHRHAALRRARALLGGARLAYPRRMIGRHYAPAVIDPGDAAVPAGRVTLACADALDPPLVPEVYDRVAALNLLDSVHNPGQLLSVVDGLCAPGGEVILASPYAWQSEVVADAHRFGGADPAGALVALLEAGTGLRARYRVEDAAELPWVLRRDARSAVSYRIHYVRARKS